MKNPKITDKQRMDFLERRIKSDSDGVVEIHNDDEKRFPPSMQDIGRLGKPCAIFTVLSQHQRGTNVRDAIDTAMKFERRQKRARG